VAGKDNLKPFTKGDKRINRKGRPVTFDALRTLAQEISHETIPGKDGNPYTVAEAILRKWATSPNPALQMKFIEVAFGKVPEEMKVRQINLNVELSTLTDEQLDRLDAGESLEQVLK